MEMNFGDTSEVLTKTEKMLNKAVWISGVKAIIAGGLAYAVPQTIPFLIAYLFWVVAFNNSRFIAAQCYIDNLRELINTNTVKISKLTELSEKTYLINTKEDIKSVPLPEFIRYFVKRVRNLEHIEFSNNTTRSIVDKIIIEQSEEENDKINKNMNDFIKLNQSTFSKKEIQSILNYNTKKNMILQDSIHIKFMHLFACRDMLKNNEKTR